MFKRRKDVEVLDIDVIANHLRGFNKDEYAKCLKIAEIWRQADIDAEIVRLGSKKAWEESQKGDDIDGVMRGLSYEG